MNIECITDAAADAPEPSAQAEQALKPIRRALLSVTDKSGLVPFAQALVQHGVELISTGGTATSLRAAGLPVRDIADLTGFPEMLDGRVKTLHPRVHGGAPPRARRTPPTSKLSIAEHDIVPIDMVVVNLYAFEKTAATPRRHPRRRSSKTSTSAAPPCSAPPPRTLRM